MARWCWLCACLWLCCCFAPGAAAAPAPTAPTVSTIPTATAASSATTPATPTTPTTPTNWDALADIVFQHLTSEQGLPHPVATAVAQTGDGFIWVATENGLARWDGYRFRVYSTDSGGPNSLPDASVVRLFVDRKDQLWCSFNNGTLARFDAKLDQFIIAPLLISSGPLRLSSIIDGDNGELLVGTSAGLARVSNNGATVHWMHQRDRNGHDVLADPIQAIERDAQGRLWLATRHGLWGQTGTRGGFEPVPLIPGPTQINLMQRVADGTMLLGTTHHGVFLLDPKADAPQPVQVGSAADADSQALLTAQRFVSIAEVRPGEVWLGTSHHGIVRLDLASGHASALRNDTTRSSSLAGDAVRHMLLDRNGLLWISTQRGVSLYDPGQRAILSLYGGANRKSQINGIDVRSVLALDRQHLLLGLAGQGVDRFDLAGQRVTRQVPELARSMVQGLCQIPGGPLFYATDSGLVRSGRAGQEPVWLPFEGKPKPLATVALGCFANRVWVGSGDGLWQFDPALARPVLQRVPGSLALAGATLRSLVWDGKHSLWIGTNSNGLYHYHMEQQQLTPISLRRRPTGVNFSFIATLWIDAQQRLWVGSQGDGIAVLPNASRPDALGARILGKAQGVHNLMINRFLPDSSGKLWVSTDAGLLRIDPASMAVDQLQRAEGVRFDSHWVGSGAQMADGTLVFGAAGGLTVVRPSALNLSAPPPRLLLTNVQIGASEVWPGSDGGSAPLIISPKANSMALEFAALDYTAAERIRYRYRLEGYDEGWINTPFTRRLASYTNLPPGRYRLLLQASNRRGEWGKPGQGGPNHLAVAITVLPHWWQTWWLRSLLALATSLLLLALVQARTRWLRRRKLELERLVDERTIALHQKQQELIGANHSLNLANADLAQSMHDLKLAQSQLLQHEKLASIGTLTAGISHEINNPCNFAHVGAHNLQQDLDELHEFLRHLAGDDAAPELWQAIEARFVKLEASLGSVREGTTRIRDLVRDLRTFARLDVANWLVTPVGDGLVATVNLVRTQYADQVQIELDLPDDPPLYCWPTQLNQVFMNLIVNACQAIAARPEAERQRVPGRLQIHSRIEGGNLLLEFADNGPGMPPEIIERIFDPFFTTKPVGEGMGMGLAISHGIIEKHHGSISVESSPGQGSRFVLRLPLHGAPEVLP